MPDKSDRTAGVERTRSVGINRRQFLAGAGAGTATALAGCSGIGGGGGEGPITIGGVYLLSGLAEALGAASEAAAQVAVDQINEEEDGIDGREVELIVRDHGNNPQGQVRSLVQEENADLLLGMTSSGVTLNTIPTWESLGVPITLTDIGTPFATEHDTERYGDRAQGIDNLFRTNANLSINTYSIAKWASENYPEGTQVANIGPDYAYGQQCWEYFKAYAEGLGAGFEWGASEFPSLGASDMTPQINTVINDDPDVVFSSMWAADVVTFVQQAVEAGLYDVIEDQLATISAAPDVFAALGDTMPEGLHWNAWYHHRAYDNDVNDTFLERYRETYEGTDTLPLPSFTGGSSYAAPFAYKQAIEAAGSTEPDDIVAEMEGMTVESPFGDLTFDPDSHQARVPTAYGTTTHDTDGMDLPYDGATLTDTGTDTLDRDTALDLLEGTDWPPGV
ncbi:MAG: ABC transporter substrate-binding protein [Haloarculaceae archaeon]